MLLGLNKVHSIYTIYLNISNVGENIAVNIDVHAQRPCVLVFILCVFYCCVFYDFTSNKDL